MKNRTCNIASVAKILVLIGAINWGLIGIGGFFGANWNLVYLLIGSWATWLEYIIYIILGVAGVVMLTGCKCCICKKVHPDTPDPQA